MIKQLTARGVLCGGGRGVQVRKAQKAIPTGLVYRQNEVTLDKIGADRLQVRGQTLSLTAWLYSTFCPLGQHPWASLDPVRNRRLDAMHENRAVKLSLPYRSDDLL